MKLIILTPEKLQERDKQIKANCLAAYTACRNIANYKLETGDIEHAIENAPSPALPEAVEFPAKGDLWNIALEEDRYLGDNAFEGWINGAEYILDKIGSKPNLE